MFKKIDSFLNSITMYKLVVIVLAGLVGHSMVMSQLNLLSFKVVDLCLSLLTIVFSVLVSNKLFAWVFGAVTNTESGVITSLILFLILQPSSSPSELAMISFIGIVAALSKYVFAWKAKHLFNPVAITLVLFGLFGYGGGIWWVASPAMLPLAILCLIIVRKLRREVMFGMFILAFLVGICFSGMYSGQGILEFLLEIVSSWPVIFFGSVMLTEPLTSPTTKKEQAIFGLLVGLLFAVPYKIGKIYSTPELALVLGNIFAYLVNKSDRYQAKLKSVERLAPTIYEFLFATTRPVDFIPGQFAELTLPHTKPDFRGVRRYFTISSEPKINEFKLGLRIIESGSSSFKKRMLQMKTGERIDINQIGGDFVLPNNSNQKLVFVAGGIGITPFCSMLRTLLKYKIRRDIVLVLILKDETDMAYKELIDNAQKHLGLKLVLVVSEKGERINENLIKKEVADWKDRMFYISGSNTMVDSVKMFLGKLGLPKDKIKTDFFPGY